MKEQIEKQAIAEMARVMMKHCEIDNQCGSCHWSTCNECLAEVLYNADYRKQEWISVEDRLPDTDEVLVYCRKGVGHAAPKKQGLDKMDWDVFFNITGTTHWMPLPQPPKMKGGE